VLFQLTILNPPVVGATYPERQRLKAYRETVQVPAISTYPTFRAGNAAVYRTPGTGRAVLLLPDSGTGPWLYENYLGSLGSTFNLNAVSLRGMRGASAAATATVNDYLDDSREALDAVLQASGRQKVVIAGTGLGSLLALRLANERPDDTEALILISPYLPRDRTGLQDWLARNIGERIYANVFRDNDAASDFWRSNYPSLVTQAQLAQRTWEQHASKKVPYEYPPVIREIVLGKIPWLQEQYSDLEDKTFPVLQLSGRYDVTNPEASQLRLRSELGTQLGERYYSSVFNSGKLIPLDWKWKESANALVDFLLDLKLDTPIVEEQEQLEPGLQTSN
jgi:pimeloyl-ACP methyl ester carboxylesterase